jgi:hypothetical protein
MAQVASGLLAHAVERLAWPSQARELRGPAAAQLGERPGG